MTNAEKIRALRERMKAQGLTQRSIYLPKDQPAPTQEELAAFLAWRKTQAGEPHAIQATVTEKVSETPAVTLPITVDETEAAQKEVKCKEREEEARQETLKEARREGRRLARQADHNREAGRIDGLCTAAAFFVRKNREDIARDLLAAHFITRSMAEDALQSDKRTRSATFDALDTRALWYKQPDMAL
jgi:hypothetical protein